MNILKTYGTGVVLSVILAISTLTISALLNEKNAGEELPTRFTFEFIGLAIIYLAVTIRDVFGKKEENEDE